MLVGLAPVFHYHRVLQGRAQGVSDLGQVENKSRASPKQATANPGLVQGWSEISLRLAPTLSSFLVLPFLPLQPPAFSLSSLFIVHHFSLPALHQSPSTQLSVCQTNAKP